MDAPNSGISSPQSRTTSSESRPANATEIHLSPDSAVPQFSQMTVEQHLAEAKRLIVAATGPGELQEADEHLKEVLRRNPKNAEVSNLYTMATAAAVQIAARNQENWTAQSKIHPQGDTAWTKCQSAVMANLKAPSTANFASYSSSQVADMGGWKYRVQSYVDAENSFGAHMRTPYSCTVQCVDLNKCSVIQLDVTQ